MRDSTRNYILYYSVFHIKGSVYSTQTGNISSLTIISVDCSNYIANNSIPFLFLFTGLYNFIVQR